MKSTSISWPENISGTNISTALNAGAWESLMVEKTTIPINVRAKIETWRDGEWIIIYTADGGGSETTVSLLSPQALDLASVLRGAAITASGLTK
jgi:hypothetical protein